MQASAAMHATKCIANIANRHHILPLLPSLTRSTPRKPLNAPGPTRIYSGEAPAAAEDTTLESTSTTGLAPPREGYRSFVMQGCEFLVRQTPDGALDLADTFVLDEATGSSDRASTVGDIPSEPRFYQPAEVCIEYGGNILEGKDESRTVLRVYLARILSEEPYKVGLDEFYMLDSANRSLEKLEIQRVAPIDAPEHELRARIRDRWVVIDTATSLPSPEDTVQAAMAGGTSMSKLEQEARARGEDVVPSVGTSASAGRSPTTAAVATSGRTKAGNAGQDGEDGQSGDYEENSDLLYDDELLKDFLVEVDDESETDFDEDGFGDMEME
ncbi:hypothetical protein NADE_006040 [Nannochloris sp. 'desiccata']|nr:hypothetical protein KSW81_007939 [Chlorella desiccata (nom. nud.)]KAH7619195.1 hypothetical protein NADE_006040 [Chlorella desiccata (nom. nud.)]